MDPINKIFVPPELNRYKLNTEFGEDYHSHITPAADSTVTVTKWKMVKLIGQGAFGVVFLEKERKGALRAVKMIYKKDIKNLREMLVLTKLKAHPQYFVQFFGWFENQSNIYLVMEYVGNGDLKNLIEGGDIVEDNAKDITKQLLKGLGIMHEKKICHRDLKPQNILISSLSPMRVKISDFGFSKQFSDDTALVSKLGTRSYLAPELWDYRTPDPSGYTTAVDIWSLGCLVYAIVTGAPPDLREFHDYVEDRIRFPKEKLIECDASPTAIEFISELLRPQPAVRLTAELALEHPWLNVEDDDDEDAEDPPRAVARNADHRFAAPEFWGNFVVRRAEREPRPSKTFSRLLRGIATHLLKFQKTTDKKAILPETMVHFYTQYRFEGERTDWKALFGRRSDACLSSIYRDLNCEHFNMSHACVPSLTSNGFETWMFTRLMAYPDSESKRIQQVVSSCPIIDINSGLQFPGPIPWQSFPETYDQAIRDRLQKAWRDWPQDLEELIC